MKISTLFEVPHAIAIWCCLIVARVTLILFGFIIVPIALLQAQTYELTRRPYGARLGTWVYRGLPSWAFIWDNRTDGTLGDTRGYWANEATPFGLPVGHWFSQWWWLCIRNPTNYLRFVPPFSCDVSLEDNRPRLLSGQSYVRDKNGHSGYQFVKSGGYFYSFYYVHQWSETRAFVLRIGHKVEPRHGDMSWTYKNVTKRFKGFTARISPYNRIT